MRSSVSRKVFEKALIWPLYLKMYVSFVFVCLQLTQFSCDDCENVYLTLLS